MTVRQSAKQGTLCAETLPGECYIRAQFPMRAGQQKRHANVGEEADADFRHCYRRAIGGDTVGGMGREAHATAHRQSVDQSDDWFRIARDQYVEAVFRRPEFFRKVVTGLRRVVERTDVAAGGESAVPCAVDKHRADRGIVRPFPHERRHGRCHVERDRVQRLRPIERDPPQRTQLTDNNVAVMNQLLAHRPTSCLATMTRMISLVPSKIWCTRRSRTIFSMPYSDR
jgi:hypothetical protein